MNTSNENKVSPEDVAITRKIAARIQSEILQRLAEVTQSRAAECIGMDESSISRKKASLDDACLLLAALGLQIVDANSMVVSHEDFSAYKRLAYKCLQHEMEGKRM